MKRAALIGAAASVLVLLLCGGAGMALVSGVLKEGAAPVQFANVCNGAKIDPDAKFPKVGGLDAEQIRHAAIIIKVGCDMQAPPRGWVIALATAYQESKLRNINVAVDHDSLGLFQQRPSQGWGTPDQLTDPVYASRKFYQKLLNTKGWQTMPLTDVVREVQNPDERYIKDYTQWEDLASDLVTALTGCPGGVATRPEQADQGCAATGSISPAGWTRPARGPINSRFRPPPRPGHDGVDIGAPRGTTIRAASAGVVVTVLCNASTGNCDVDGSPLVLGCGWYVDILHASDVITRYCHMLRRPSVSVGDSVKAGQPIGVVGSSGNSSGPHLHFEVHLNRDQSDAGAVDPIPFMAAKGAGLRR